MFTHDPHSARADALLGFAPIAFVSDFAAAELASALGRLARMRLLSIDEARAALATFDIWKHRESTVIATSSSDIAVAESYLRRFDTELRTADALNLAIADRCRLMVAVYDDVMANAARTLGIALAPTSSAS